ncbi:MAG: hypothetical protein PUF92_03005 [Subdoligranulum variabile]|jgi:hypothetical protein|nr:hypothetical protein [Subdoligranulum variabile]MDD6424430.1 hypothetical protein [Subdoligranulum variabile]
MAGKQDDYGYFGKGIDGYVHYKQAFDRNFSGNKSMHNSVKQHQPKSAQSSSIVHSAPKDSPQNRFISDCHSKKEFDKLHKDAVKSLNATSFTDPYDLYDPLDADSDNDTDSYNDISSNKLDDSMMYSESFYYPPAQQQHSQHNPPSKSNSDKDSARSTFGTIIMLILIWIGAMSLIMGIPYLLGFLLSGSAGGADSFGGILILVVGAILIFFL